MKKKYQIIYLRYFKYQGFKKKAIYYKIMNNHQVIAEYIWLGGNGELRSKTKVLHDFRLQSLEAKYFPMWNYDGSSTEQAEGLNSELKLKPVAVYYNPFSNHHALANSFLVLCETLDKNDKPLPTNTRSSASDLFETHKAKTEKPWFGIEQEYFIKGNKSTFKGITQGQYYCSVGSQNAYYREVAEEHMDLCLRAGLKVSGINAEVAPCQWEYQIGPCEGIDAGDQIWISRWIMERLSEKHNVIISWEPKPIVGINGSGCHTNYSTESRRKDGGLNFIYSAIEKLRLKHTEHMAVYGKDNDKRMSGEYETANFNYFSFNKDRSVDRGASIRVGYDTIKDGKGYFEDRRPASNMDPYLVTSKIFETTCM